MASDEHADGDVRTTYVGAIGSSVDPDASDVVLGVIREHYDFLDRTVDRNLQALAPPRRLLDTFKRVEETAKRDGEPDSTRIAWESVDFRERYLAHLDGPASQPVDAIRQTLAKGKTVWLVCLEADETFCHRRLLAARLRDEEPASWRALHEPVTRADLEDDDGPRQENLGSFTGGGRR